ncbi:MULTISPECIES: DUF3558 domain-containing protein [unclassified Gordonia (in: high G+C Gram-positive bacteria)]|uniref:DUF3558 domain-containing protein n=1 Tax=unclassified Gordonia (in: high G+C Gram-positive bacteria) TaxID=2657482 RepID=UPI001F0DF6A0|nr:DUF3558 domain-containing protein [Gordonia sp. ABSL49_1]MCH5644610.1 DUF3558 domain-containing protein [Gordonia sp. ABSL49_1]
MIRWLTVLTIAALALTACSSDDDTADPGGPQGPTAPGRAGAGPFFGACGGVDTDEVVQITGFGQMANTVNNPSACVWSADALQNSSVASFNWYRGSPIGRERATVQLSKDTVVDVDINGHRGFIASSPTICEIGIQFDADFFEWSVRSGVSPAEGGPAIDQICAAAKQLSRMSIERAS